MSDSDSLAYTLQLDRSRQMWNAAAATFDNEPDHGLRDPKVLTAWTKLLSDSLPQYKGTVLDIGCGTGSLSLVTASLGYEVTGIDLSPEMISRAKAKASHLPINFRVMDAAFPKLPAQQFDAIVCRHLLWALPQPEQVLERWKRLLKPDGRLVIIEGFWYTGAGIHAKDLHQLLLSSFFNISIQNLSDQDNLWGRAVDDERYVIVADRVR